MNIRLRNLSQSLLLLTGIAIALLLWGGFAQRYSLNEFGDRPRQSIGTLTRYSNEGAYWYIGGMAALFVCYSFGAWLLKRDNGHAGQQRGLLAVVIAGAAGFSVIMLPMYPVDASDIYDYIIRGRMSAIHDLNPLQAVPQQVAGDPFYRFASWRRTPSAYGPGWEITAHTVSLLTAGSSRDTQVIAYKLIAVLGYAVTGLLIALTLRQIAPRRVLIGTYLFLWNPLVVYMTAGTGHNDAFMTAFIAAALYCLSRRWYTTATVSAVIGTLVKFIPALLIPVIVLFAFRELGWRRWLRYALVTTLVSSLLALILYAPYWHGPDTLRAERRSLMFTGSIPTVLRHWLMPALDGVTDLATPAARTPNSAALLANTTLILFGLYTTWQLWRLWRDHSEAAIVPYRVTAHILFAYLLVASMWFHAWYVIWLLAVAALLDDTPLRRLALVFSYLVTWQAFLYNYMTFETRAGERLPWLDLLPVAIYMGTSWGYIGWYQWHAWSQRLLPSLERAFGTKNA